MIHDYVTQLEIAFIEQEDIKRLAFDAGPKTISLFIEFELANPETNKRRALFHICETD